MFVYVEFFYLGAKAPLGPFLWKKVPAVSKKVIATRNRRFWSLSTAIWFFENYWQFFYFLISICLAPNFFWKSRKLVDLLANFEKKNFNFFICPIENWVFEGFSAEFRFWCKNPKAVFFHGDISGSKKISKKSIKLSVRADSLSVPAYFFYLSNRKLSFWGIFSRFSILTFSILPLYCRWI